MATYKLIQDIEAEDHILGPLTFRQFVFALIAAFLYYICFIIVVKFHALFMLLFFLPPALFCTFFAFPWGGDQPTEVWALAKLHFFFTPRRRIWNQSGVKELVTITVPKKIERVYTDGLSQAEVKSRLQALANTLDSRGWAVKHADAMGYTSQQAAVLSSDRLIGVTDAPQEVPNYTPAEDILDTANNPVAQQFESMIDKSTREYRERLLAQMQSPLPSVASGQPSGQVSDSWFMSSSAPSPTTGTAATIAAGNISGKESELSSRLKNQAQSDDVATSNLRTLQPTAADTSSDAAAATDPKGLTSIDDTAMTASGDPAILSLSNNDDLNVATLAREAQKARGNDNGTKDEVVISLH